MNFHLICPHALNVKIKRSFKKIIFIISACIHVMEACRKISIETYERKNMYKDEF